MGAERSLGGPKMDRRQFAQWLTGTSLAIGLAACGAPATPAAAAGREVPLAPTLMPDAAPKASEFPPPPTGTLGIVEGLPPSKVELESFPELNFLEVIEPDTRLRPQMETVSQIFDELPTGTVFDVENEDLEASGYVWDQGRVVLSSNQDYIDREGYIAQVDGKTARISPREAIKKYPDLKLRYVTEKPLILPKAPNRIDIAKAINVQAVGGLDDGFENQAVVGWGLDYIDIPAQGNQPAGQLSPLTHDLGKPIRAWQRAIFGAATQSTDGVQEWQKANLADINMTISRSEVSTYNTVTTDGKILVVNRLGDRFVVTSFLTSQDEFKNPIQNVGGVGVVDLNGLAALVDDPSKLETIVESLTDFGGNADLEAQIGGLPQSKLLIPETRQFVDYITPAFLSTKGITDRGSTTYKMDDGKVIGTFISSSDRKETKFKLVGEEWQEVVEELIMPDEFIPYRTSEKPWKDMDYAIVDGIPIGLFFDPLGQGELSMGNQSNSQSVYQSPTSIKFDNPNQAERIKNVVGEDGYELYLAAGVKSGANPNDSGAEALMRALKFAVENRNFPARLEDPLQGWVKNNGVQILLHQAQVIGDDHILNKGAIGYGIEVSSDGILQISIVNPYTSSGGIQDPDIHFQFNATLAEAFHYIQTGNDTSDLVLNIGSILFRPANGQFSPVIQSK